MSEKRDDPGKPAASRDEADELGATPKQAPTTRYAGAQATGADAFARKSAEAAETFKAFTTLVPSDPLTQRLKDIEAGLQGTLAKMLRGMEDTGLSATLKRLEADSTVGLAARLSAVRELDISPLSRITLPELPWHDLARTVEQFSHSLRPSLGPIEDWLRRPDTLLAATHQAQSLSEALKGIERRFRLPTIDETTTLARQLTETLRVPQNQRDLEAVMQRVSSPWLEITREMKSVQGFAALQGIGSQLKLSVPAFDESVAASLRDQLGDWRDSLTLPADIGDWTARSAFYGSRGLNPALTNFPAAAFREAMHLARLDQPPPPEITLYRTRIPAESATEEEGFHRTNAAHDWLMRFETHLRRFIDKRMSEAFGADWVKHQVPGETRREWVEKRRLAQEAGEDVRPLIAYADFTDYVRILCRSDNWDAVFKQVFRRQEAVRESLQRLYPIRLCTMHARLITQDDELYLHVEVQRLLKAIGVI